MAARGLLTQTSLSGAAGSQGLVDVIEDVGGPVMGGTVCGVSGLLPLGRPEAHGYIFLCVSTPPLLIKTRGRKGRCMGGSSAPAMWVWIVISESWV